MHLYSERTVSECPRCLKWFRPGHLGCAVMHHGDGCCHYGDTEVPAPAGARRQDAADELSAQITVAQAEAERGETLDLGSFAGYADEVPVAFIQVVGGGFVRVTSQDPAAYRS